MNSQFRPFRLTAISAAMLAAFGALNAAADDITELTKPDSSVQVGLGNVDVNNRRFGLYNGMNEEGGYGLLDFSVIKRDDITGTWLRFLGRNVGLDNRELRFDHERQGQWGYYLEYGQLPRNEPYQASTGISGIGSNTLTVPSSAATTGTVSLKTERERLGLGFSKRLAEHWNVKVDFRNEKKEGARLWARGTTGGGFEFAPEPIDSTIRQLDANLSYSGERLQLSAGYYATLYNNAHSGLDFIGGGNRLSSFTPIALPPDNESHQLLFSGAFAFSPTTHGNFKFSSGRAKQNDNFVSGANVPLAPGIGSNLQGRVDTKLAQMGLVSRPLPKLTLRANLRHEDRDDKTPVLLYSTLASATSTFDGANEPRSIRTTNGKFEASYALPMSFRLTGGVDYDEKKRNTSPVRIVTFRDQTEETTYRAELRRSMSDTVTGSIAILRSERDGSPFQITTLNNGSVAASGNRVAPIHLADRDRDLVRMTMSWQVSDPFSVQLRLDESRDKYSPIHALGIGPRTGDSRNYALDLGYTLSDKWTATAWASRNESEQGQSQHTGSGTSGLLIAALLKNTTEAWGISLRGKPSTKLEVGADASHSDNSETFDQQRLNTVSPNTVVAPLPEIKTRTTRVQLFAKYALQKNASLRVDFIHDRYSTDDWTWSTWTFADGTRMLESPTQKVNFIGIAYQYRWQ